MLQQLKKHISDNLFFWIASLATIVVYFNSLHFNYISWDDPEMVFKNKDVKTFSFLSFFKNQYVGNYIPLTMLVHAITWLIFESNTFGHHLINLLFHIVNGFLVYKITIQLFKEKNSATIAVIIFLLHPIQVESVNWISELKNVGYTLFFLLGMLQYLLYLNNRKTKQFLWTLLSFVLSCLFKPSAVVFPLVLICVDILQKQKFEIKFIFNKIPFLLVAFIFGLINLKTQASAQFINYAHQFPFYERMVNAGYAIYFYLKLFTIPINLSVIYPFPANSVVKIVIGLVFLMGIVLMLFWLYRKKQFGFFVIILFILLNLVLVLQFVPFGEVLNADRYMYLPIIGLGWLLGLLVSKINLKLPIVPTVLILVLASLTFLRSNKWQSSIVLYEDIVKKYPDNFLALNSLGVEYMFKNNNDKALMYFNRAINIAPYNYKGFYNRALLHLKNNQPKAAIKDLNQVLIMYNYIKAYVARASAHYSLMDYNSARIDAKAALLKDKNNHRAYFILGNCDNDQNDLQNAISFYNRAIELNKDEPDYYFKRAIALGKQQNFKECIENLNSCIQLNSNYFEAYYWRGVAKVNLKLNPCEDFRMAIEGSFAPASEAFEKHCK